MPECVWIHRSKLDTAKTRRQDTEKTGEAK